MKLSRAQLRQIIHETIVEAHTGDDTAEWATFIASIIADMIESHGQELMDKILGTVNDVHVPRSTKDIERWAGRVAERVMKESSFMTGVIASLVRQAALTMYDS